MCITGWLTYLQHKLAAEVMTAIVFAVALGGISPTHAQDAASTPQANAERGQDSKDAGGLKVDLSFRPRMTAEEAAQIPPPPEPRGVSEEVYKERKTNANRLFVAPSAPAEGAVPRALDRETPGILQRIDGQSQIGTITPPDMAIAVSASHVVQVVNSSVAVYNKAGTLQSGFPKSLKNLFPGSTGDVGDPRAFYDWSSNRFVIVADDFSGGVMWLAASATDNPTGLWNIYSFGPWGSANCRQAGSSCADFPTLGYDDTTIYLGVTFFRSTGGLSDYILLLPKANIYAGSGFGYNFWFNLTWGGTAVDTVQPVTLLGPSEHPRAGFAINSFNINFGNGQCSGSSGCNGLVIWAFSNNLQATGSPGPEFSAVLVPTANTYHLPAQASEPGCANCIDTDDVRISGTPVYHAGVISASLNTNGRDNHSHVLWFQVHPTLNDNDPRCSGAFGNACPQIIGAQLINEDCYFCGGQGAGGSTYYGTLIPDEGGNLTMVFNYSDNNINPESAYTSRRVTQTANTMHDAGIVLCGGVTGYHQGRWGDYTAAVGDLSSPSQGYMWFSAMHVIAQGNWGTCIGRNGFTAATQP
jgi:hypothetical protein